MQLAARVEQTVILVERWLNASFCCALNHLIQAKWLMRNEKVTLPSLIYKYCQHRWITDHISQHFLVQYKIPIPASGKIYCLRLMRNTLPQNCRSQRTMVIPQDATYTWSPVLWGAEKVQRQREVQQAEKVQRQRERKWFSRQRKGTNIWSATLLGDVRNKQIMHG